MEDKSVMPGKDEPLDLSLNCNFGVTKDRQRLDFPVINSSPGDNEIKKDQEANEGYNTMEFDGSVNDVQDMQNIVLGLDETTDGLKPIAAYSCKDDVFPQFDVHTEDESELSLYSDGIKITLQDPGLWRDFHDIGTEMIINRGGRRMFPHIVTTFSGLEPSGIYKLMLEIETADDRRYKYVNNCWTPMGMADPGIKNPPFYHTEGVVKGSALMESRTSFAKVKLTNNRESTDGNVVLHSMHKYIPRITLIKLKENRKDAEKKYVFSFRETVFIAVTAYQNDQITKLKIHNNPFAKAFRDGRSVNTKTNLPGNSTPLRRKSDEKKDDVQLPVKKKMHRRYLSHHLKDIHVFRDHSTTSCKQCCHSSFIPSSHCNFGTSEPVDSETGPMSYSTWPYPLGKCLPTTPYPSHDLRLKMPQMPFWFPYYQFIGQEMPTTAQDLSCRDIQTKHTEIAESDN